MPVEWNFETMREYAQGNCRTHVASVLNWASDNADEKDKTKFVQMVLNIGHMLNQPTHKSLSRIYVDITGHFDSCPEHEDFGIDGLACYYRPENYD